jgi:hypothetical protein
MADPVVFDPDSSWQALEDRMAQEKDPICHALLEEVRNHMRAEIGGQLEPLMDTLIAEPLYHFRMFGPEGGPKGHEAVHAFYKNMIDNGGNRFQFEIQRIYVDHGGVVTEGKMRQTVSGEAAIAAGVEQIDDEKVDPGKTYLTENHILTVWPAGEGGKLVGEDIFFGSAPSHRRIAE